MGRRQGFFRVFAAALVASSCALAQETSAQETSSPSAAEKARAQALAEMERLRDEIQILAAVRGAQAALLAWNRERARTGAPPAALSTAPCRDAALEPWCRLLPATFGNDVSGKNSGGDGR